MITPAPLPPLARARARLAGRPDPRPLVRNVRGQFARPADAAPPPDPPLPKGLRQLRARIMLRGLGVVDKRTHEARAVLDWRRQLIDDLGGEAGLSAARKALVEVAARSKLYLDHIDAVLVARRSLLTHRRARVLPLVDQRRKFADSLTKTLVALGVGRQAAPALDLARQIALVERDEDPTP